MHNYSVRNHSKVKMIYWISALAVFVTPFLANSLEKLFSQISFVGSIYREFSILGASFSAFFVFSILWFVYSKYLWKVLYRINVGKIPNLAGYWECEGVGKKYEGQSVENLWNGVIEIEQDYEKILIKLTTGQSQSKSHSLIGEIELHGKNEATLSYMYENEPNRIENGLNQHKGFCRLSFDLSSGTATGRYYTDCDRSSYGSMKLTKKGAI